MIPAVRGTRDWMPEDSARLSEIERGLMDRFDEAGFRTIRTPILEGTELHERKSGAGIVSKLFELADGRSGRLCLRPELTASVVRAYIDAPEPPVLPWRVCTSGPVFRMEPSPGPTRLREFTQAGVELLGAPGPEADAEVIALAMSALEASGVAGGTLRLGHTGLIVELLEHSGLPAAAVSGLVEHLSDAAAEGRSVRALESALDRLSGWLGGPLQREAESVLPAVDRGDDPGVDRLFRQLVPRVTGRRSGREIIKRLRDKWDLGHSLAAALDGIRDRIHELADLRGPAVEVLERLEADYARMAPGAIGGLRETLGHLRGRGVPLDRITLDLGFGHGIGFYSDLIFELAAPTPDGPVAVCHGGRYDGLARVLGSDRDPHGVGFAFGVERLYHARKAETAGS